METKQNNSLLLQKNTVKFKILFIMGILSFLGCSQESKQTIYKYNSEEYNQKIKEFNVSIGEAAELVSKFYDEKNISENKQEILLDIVLGDFYIFPSTPAFYNPKTTKYILSGIWINGKTGEVLEKDTEKYVKVLLKIPFTKTTRYSKNKI